MIFLYSDFETTMPGWPRVFGNQEAPEPMGGFELDKKPGVKAEKIQALTPLGWLTKVCDILYASYGI